LNNKKEVTFNKTSYFKNTFLTLLQGEFIKFQGLSPQIKILTLIGYSLVFIFLFLTLIFEVFNNKLPLLSFSSQTYGLRYIPYIVLFTTAIGYIFGWAYILTGALNCHRKFFFLIMLVFALQLLFMIPSGIALLLWLVTTPLIIIGIPLIYLFTYKKTFWYTQQIKIFFIWCFILFYYLMLFFLFNQKDTIAQNLEVAFESIKLLNTPIWIFSGLALIDLAVYITEKGMSYLSRILPQIALASLSVFVIFTKPTWIIILASIFPSKNIPQLLRHD